MSTRVFPRRGRHVALALVFGLISVVVWFCGSVSAGAAPSVKAATKVTVCIDGEAPPQESMSGAHKPIGSEIDILRSIAASNKLALSFTQLQFNGLVPALLSKQCDIAAAGLFVKPERLKVIAMVIYSINGQTLMVRKGNEAGITGYNNSLAGHTIGITAGYSVIPPVEAKCKAVGTNGRKPCSVVTFSSPVDTYQALKAGKVDTVIDATTSEAYFTSKNPTTFEVVKGAPFLTSKVGFGVRKGSPLVATLTRGVAAMYKNGSMCRILNKWQIGNTASAPHHC
jgi:polar amino acid transport system substrate-binding protein